MARTLNTGSTGTQGSPPSRTGITLATKRASLNTSGQTVGVATPLTAPLTDALATSEGRLLTAIATANGHGHPLQYANDVLAALKKITPA